MKSDERKLLRELQRHARDFEPVSVREVVHRIGINEKRAACICEKWDAKGWYDYGVNVLTGWLTEEGIAVEPPEATDD